MNWTVFIATEPHKWSSLEIRSSRFGSELMCKIFFVQEFVHGRQGAKEQAATEGSSLGRKGTAWFVCYS